MSSKADDFDVRYRDAGAAGRGRPAPDGGYRGNAGDVDYDLGYDSTGWDTQGFRRPETDFVDTHEADRSYDVGHGGVGTAVRPMITAARPGAAVTAVTRARRAQRRVPKNLRS